MFQTFECYDNQLRVKQEGNTLRDVTNSYFTDLQVIKIILIAAVLVFCSKFGFRPRKNDISL